MKSREPLYAPSPYAKVEPRPLESIPAMAIYKLRAAWVTLSPRVWRLSAVRASHE